MKNFKTFYENKELPKEMVDWYEKRTNNHINNVIYFIKKLVNEYPELKERSLVHDDSKWKEPEYTPYIWITWKYKCENEGWDFESYNPPENIDDMMNKATHHHVTTNSHHPEYHSSDKTDIINRKDRDKPPENIVDATSMPDIDIVEMCCDWAAMSLEKGGTPQEWANKNVNVRWKFKPEQEKLIYQILDKIWNE